MMMMSKARFKGATFCLPLVRKCILGRTAPPSPPSIFTSVFLKMLPSPHTKGFSPQIHGTDQNAEYIAKDDNLVFLPHNKDMSKETLQELGIVCHSLLFQVTNVVLH